MSSEEPIKSRRICAADSGAATATVTPVGALLARHILRDGETILLALKPSWWFIVLSSLWFSAIVLIVTLSAIAFETHTSRKWFYIEVAIFLIAGKLMLSVLQWMGRLYILTDMRIIRLSGVFKLDIFDCALRKIGRTGIVSSIRERLCATGSIEIIPDDDTRAPGLWQTIPRPHQTHELICSTISKAKHHGYGAAA